MLTFGWHNDMSVDIPKLKDFRNLNKKSAALRIDEKMTPEYWALNL